MFRKIIFTICVWAIAVSASAQNINIVSAVNKHVSGINADTLVYVNVNTILPEYKGNEQIKVDVVPENEFCTYMVSDGTMLQNEGSVSYIIHYPIKIESDPVFTHKALVADESVVHYILNKISKKASVPEKCGVFMTDNECVKFACLCEKNEDVYKTYCPLYGDKNSKVEIIKSNKIREYILKHIKDDHKIYSVVRVGSAYLVKEFEQ